MRGRAHRLVLAILALQVGMLVQQSAWPAAALGLAVCGWLVHDADPLDQRSARRSSGARVVPISTARRSSSREGG